MSDNTLSATEIVSNTGILRPDFALKEAAAQLKVDPEELADWFTFAGLAVESEAYMRVSRLISDHVTPDGWVAPAELIRAMTGWMEELQRQALAVTMVSALSRFNVEIRKRGEL
jgi:hypothetical protein